MQAEFANSGSATPAEAEQAAPPEGAENSWQLNGEATTNGDAGPVEVDEDGFTQAKGRGRGRGGFRGERGFRGGRGGEKGGHGGPRGGDRGFRSGRGDRGGGIFYYYLYLSGHADIFGQVSVDGAEVNGAEMASVQEVMENGEPMGNVVLGVTVSEVMAIAIEKAGEAEEEAMDVEETVRVVVEGVKVVVDEVERVVDEVAKVVRAGVEVVVATGAVRLEPTLRCSSDNYIFFQVTIMRHRLLPLN